MRNLLLAILCAGILSLGQGAPVNTAAEAPRFTRTVTPLSAEDTPPTTPASPGPARAHIEGPKDGFPGDFIDLDASQSICDLGCLKWFVKPARFLDGRPTHKVSKDKYVCSLSSRPGTYTVMLAVSNASGPDLTEWIVTVPGTVPPSNPPPVQPKDPTAPPPVDPPPPQPENYGLAKWVQESIVFIDIPSRQPGATKLADAYRRWAVNGVVAKDAEEFAKVQASMNRVILTSIGSNIPKEWDYFMTALAKKLNDSKLDTIAKSQKAWLEIAEGLEKVAK